MAPVPVLTLLNSASVRVTRLVGIRAEPPEPVITPPNPNVSLVTEICREPLSVTLPVPVMRLLPVPA